MRTTICTKRQYSTYRPTLDERQYRLDSNYTIENKNLSSDRIQNFINTESLLMEKINKVKRTISEFTTFKGYNFYYDEYESVTHKTRSQKYKFDVSEMVRNIIATGKTVRVFWNLNNEVRIELES